MEFSPFKRNKSPSIPTVSEAPLQYPRDLDHVSSPEDFLKSVDFESLNSIFDSLTEKSKRASGISNSGQLVTPAQIDFIQPTQTERGTKLKGTAVTHTGKIELVWNSDLEAGKEREQAVTMLKTLVHEATHVRGGHKVEWGENTGPKAEEPSVVSIRSGLSERNTLYGGRTQEFGVSLNEAVTENIAHEVFVEYLTRTGNSGYLKDREMLKVLDYNASYETDRLALTLLIDSLSENLAVPRDAVWKGFVQAYMSGNVEIQEVLYEISVRLEEDPRNWELISTLAKSIPAQNLSEILDAYGGVVKELPNKFSIFHLIKGIKDVKEQTKILALRKQLLDRIINSFDATKLQNVLGLR